MRHPDWPEMTLQEVLEHGPPHLPNSKACGGYVEYPARVSVTFLVNVQCNRYGVPVEYAPKAISVRLYPEELLMVHDDFVMVRTCIQQKHH